MLIRWLLDESSPAQIQEAAKDINEVNMADFRDASHRTNEKLEGLGKLKADVEEDFDRFSDAFEKIKNRPEFSGGNYKTKIGEFSFAEIKMPSKFKDAIVDSAMGGLLGVALGIAGSPFIPVAIVYQLVSGNSKKKKAEKILDAVHDSEVEILKVINYLNRLRKSADMLETAIKKVKDIYDVNVKKLIHLVKSETDWNVYSDDERLLVENNILIVQVLHKMINTPLLKITETDNDGNPVKDDVDEEAVTNVISSSNTALVESELMEALEDAEQPTQQPGVSYDELFNKRRKEQIAQRTTVTIDTEMIVPKGKTKIFKDNIVIFHDTIIVSEGELTFDNCEIDTTPLKYNETKKAVELTNGTLKIKRSEYKKTPHKPNVNNTRFSIIADRNSTIIAVESSFNNIFKFVVGEGEYKFSNCIFENTYPEFIRRGNVEMKHCTVVNPDFYFFVDIINLIMSDCIFTCKDNSEEFGSLARGTFSDESDIDLIGKNRTEEIRFDTDNGNAEIENCTFEGIAGFSYFLGSMRGCSFLDVGKIECRDDCDSSYYSRKPANFIDCEFKFSESGWRNDIFDNGFLQRPFKVLKCTFSKAGSIETVKANKLIVARAFSTPSEITDCTFDGFEVSGGLGGSGLIYPSGFYKKSYSKAKVTNCEFRNCKTGLPLYVSLLGDAERSNDTIRNSVNNNALKEKFIETRRDSYDSFFAAKNVQLINVKDCIFINCSSASI